MTAPLDPDDAPDRTETVTVEVDVSELAALRRLAEVARCEYWGSNDDRSLWCYLDKDDANRRDRWCDTCKALAALAALEDK